MKNIGIDNMVKEDEIPRCKRQCDLEVETMICKSCGLYFGE